ncbi:transposase [Streptomyces sp. NPDC020875]|uniref:transposase n=1 Tax=Streptomyces sp. NPDC020875 TaxID=3154898 RepID=UPI0033DEC5A9
MSGPPPRADSSSPPACSPRSATTQPASPPPRDCAPYAGTAPLTCASGSSHSVTRRSVCNRTLRRTAHHWAFGALNFSPGCRALYDARRERGDGYAAALRHVAGRLLTGLHHCLLTGQHYDEAAMFRP